MKHLSWAIAVATLCGTIAFSAYHFNSPAILFGLVGISCLPYPEENQAVREGG